MKYFVHDKALCETEHVGEGTRIWAFAHILPGATIGIDCNICDHVFIENDVIIGDRVTVKCGVQLWDGIEIEDDVFIGPNASFSNDKFPRSKKHQEVATRTRIGKGASIGVNCTILPGLNIGRYAMVGGGTVVAKDVPPFAIVTGNPGQIVGYVDSKTPDDTTEQTSASTQDTTTVVETSVPGVTLHNFPHFEDLRGGLVLGDMAASIPFSPKRFFIVNEVPSQYVRGEHAHRQCKQFLMCLTGSVAVVVDDNENREEILLDRTTLGLYLPEMVWATQFRHSPDMTLLVFASELYDDSDYIRDYEDFLKAKRGEN